MIPFTKPTDPGGLVLEAWAQGLLVGATVIMAATTMANIRRGVLLHKIIVVELFFGIWHGFFIFNDGKVYGWYLSVSAIFLNTSWSLHNVIAWMKNRPFLGRKTSAFYITTIILVQPYWIIEVYANFTYFNKVDGINDMFLHSRPFEALFRDPWWIFTTCNLLYNIRSRYGFKFIKLIRISPRFGVMLGAMILSIAFTVVDIFSVTDIIRFGLPVGINPFWKLSFIFKLLTDTVILDDFKTALDKLCTVRIASLKKDFGVKVDVEYGTSRDAGTTSNDMTSDFQHTTVVESNGASHSTIRSKAHSWSSWLHGKS